MAKSVRFLIPTTLFLLLIGIVLTIQPGTVEAQDFGSSWTGSYFNTSNLSGAQVLGRLDNQINFNFGSGSPDTSFVNPDNFSVRWQGLQNFATGGTYRFTAVYDDGIRVRIDGSTIIDDFNNNGTLKTTTADVNISQGTRDIVVEYVEFTGTAAVQFYWQAVSLDAQVTGGPSPTPTATGVPAIPQGALTAIVIRAGVLNVRDAPSIGGNRIGRILRGQAYQVVGRDPDARWFLLELGGFQGWASGYYLFINGNEFNAPVRSATSAFGIPAGFNDTGVIVQTRATMRLRANPNITSAQIGRVTWGAFLPVAGRTAAGDWYQVLWKGTIGWVFTGFSDVVQGNYNDIPIIR
ncbi:MAG: SH3 domain-containing protein [Anaerolineae bacterium]|nr:SH3 domain-containing protein [Anaerolineae bacterium]